MVLLYLIEVCKKRHPTKVCAFFNYIFYVFFIVKLLTYLTVKKQIQAFVPVFTHICFFGFYTILFSIIAFQIKLFDFFNERISWICRRTLIIKCLLAHLVQSLKEIFFINSVVFDCLPDTDLLLQIFQFCYEVLKHFLICIARATCETSELSVSCKSMRILIL